MGVHANPKPRRPAAAAMNLAPWLGLLLVIPLLAGCTDDGTTSLPTLPSTTTSSMQNQAQVASLPWKVGESWDQTFHFGPNDETGIPIKAIVTEKDPCLRVATDNNLTAALDAAFFFQTLGCYSASGDGPVRVTGGGDGSTYQWPWYRFPLKDGDSWTEPMRNVDGNGVQYDLPVTANVTAKPGGVFATEVRGPEGGLVARYDYDPQMQWFTTALFYDYRTSDPAPAAELFRIVNSNHAFGWNGTWSCLPQWSHTISNLAGAFSPLPAFFDRHFWQRCGAAMFR